MKRPFIILLAVLALNSAPSPQTSTRLIEDVAARYASCTSYSDAGTVRQVLPGGEKVWRFKTSFERRGAFELEFTSGRQTYKGWTDSAGRVWRTWTVDGRTLERDSIAAVIGETAGISGGMSTIVPGLLGVGPTPSLLQRLTHVRLTGTESINGVPCSIIDGADKGGRPARVYIGANDHLIHRVVRTLPELGVTTTIDYTPALR